jgi:hypothetical protein
MSDVQHRSAHDSYIDIHRAINRARFHLISCSFLKYFRENDRHSQEMVAGSRFF